MAASPIPRPTASNPCAGALAEWPGASRIALPLGVAFSGGADSTALLLAAQVRWPDQVVALHVNHGLQAASADFERHCQAFCERAGIVLQLARVDASHASGESPEDAARRARYQALAALAGDHGLADVLLAQHADDQVETLLLALSRGAGLRGLAGMGAAFERHGVRFHRPLLSVTAHDIRDWLAHEGVGWVDDPTNADVAFTRNRIRAQLLPALQTAFPQFRETFARSARHAAQAQHLLDALADEDLARVGQPPAIAALRAMPPERQANALRRWLATSHGAAASTAQLDELLRQVAACSTRGHDIRLKVGAGAVQREGAVLAWYNWTVLPRGAPP